MKKLKMSNMIIAVGFIILTVFINYKYQLLKDQAATSFANDVRVLHSQVASTYQAKADVLKSIASLFKSSNFVDKQEFTIFAKDFIGLKKMQTICFFDQNKNVYTLPANSHSLCQKFSHVQKQLYDHRNDRFALAEKVVTRESQKGKIIALFSFTSLYTTADTPIDTVQVTKQLVVKGQTSRYHHQAPLPISHQKGFDLYLSAPKARYFVGFGASFYTICLLLAALVILSVQTIQMILKRESLVQDKVEQQNDKINEQKKILHHNAKLASIGELAAGVGHEINNPLSIILTQLRFYQKRKSSSVLVNENEITRMIECTQRIAKIVKSLRTFSYNDKEDEDEYFSIDHTIDKTITMLNDIYRYEHIEVSVHRHENHDEAFTYGDEGKLQQTLVNLITNAKDATDGLSHKEISVTTSLEQGHYHIKVSDNGQGILPEIREKIFDPFYTTKEVGKGTGIGLSLVHRFVHEDLKGTITCASKMGEGTTFTVTLPTFQNKNKNEETEQKAEHAPTYSYRVLLADDEEGIRDLLGKILKNMGMSVHHVHNGQQALDEYSSNPEKYDLIISDIKMPQMDGFTLLKTIRANKQIQQPKFILITGGVNIDLADKNQELLQHIDGHLYKPFTEEKIAAVFAELLPHPKAS